MSEETEKAGSFSGESWDIWHDSGGIYHLDAMDEENGEKFTVADNIVGHGRATLMRAAPALLAALELLVEAVEIDIALFEGQPRKGSRLEIARAAIARAKGGRP